MNHLVKLPRLASRAFSSSARQLKNKVPESQKIFQEDNGLPVHIKGGTGDVLLYRATMTLTIAGEERCSRCISVVQEDKARISDRNKACVETAQTFTDVSSVSVSRVQHEHQTAFRVTAQHTITNKDTKR
uniref:Cytochrome c oxidase subunit 7A1, mitochondrial n=1 Tax=Haplochromis burtoni TaxID=8153 RepID=A0A3Q2VT37_HAPBU